MEEQEVGKVTNFYVKISVAAIEVTAGVIKIGDALHFKGHTTDFQDDIGIKVKERVREHDRVYKV